MSTCYGSSAVASTMSNAQALSAIFAVWAGGDVASNELVVVGSSHMPRYSARELMKMSLVDRQRILRGMCEEAREVYSKDASLDWFSASGEQDLYDETS